MKEFGLELAKAGHPVQTRDGRKARIICFDRKGFDYPLVALIENASGTEDMYYYAVDGHFCYNGDNSELDLVMAPEKHEGWVNVYRENSTKDVKICPVCFHSRESADSHIGWTGHTYIKAIKIEWED